LAIIALPQKKTPDPSRRRRIDYLFSLYLQSGQPQKKGGYDIHPFIIISIDYAEIQQSTNINARTGVPAVAEPIADLPRDRRRDALLLVFMRLCIFLDELGDLESEEDNDNDTDDNRTDGTQENCIIEACIHDNSPLATKTPRGSGESDVDGGKRSLLTAAQPGDVDCELLDGIL
jgi:hypothetical protein